MDSLCNYYEIKYFYEASEDNMKTCTKEELLRKISEHNPTQPLYECITDDIIKIFFDIEGIPENEVLLIFNIATELCKFIGYPDSKYTVTFNGHSRHGGLSYHLYLPFQIWRKGLRNLVYKFIEEYMERDEKLCKYIDHVVYNKRRLFRVVGRIPAINKEQSHPDDRHKLIMGKLEDTIIQQPDNSLPLITKFDHVHINRSLVNKFKHVHNNTFSTIQNNKIVELTQLCNSLARKLDNMSNKLELIDKPINRAKNIYVTIMWIIWLVIITIIYHSIAYVYNRL